MQITSYRNPIAREFELLYTRAKIKTIIMKKIFGSACLICALLLLSTAGFAQYKKGDNLLNFGVGLNSYYSGGIPVSGIFETGVTKDISVGGGVDYLSYHYGFIGYNYSFSALYIAARGSYHFNELLNLNTNKVDVYGGLSLGYRSFSWSNYNGQNVGNAYGSGLFLGIHVGTRYYFSPKVGGFLELGALGSTNARLGLAFKF